MSPNIETWLKSKSYCVFGRFETGYFPPKKVGYLNKKWVNINKHLIAVVSVSNLKHIYLIDYK